MPFTDYLNNALQDHVWVQDNVYTPPSGLWLAAYTDAPSDLGTDGTEVSGGSYARATATFEFSLTTGRVVNTGALTIDDMPACSIVALTLFDDDTVGNMLAYGILTQPVTLLAGQPLNVPAGLLGILL